MTLRVGFAAQAVIVVEGADSARADIENVSEALRQMAANTFRDLGEALGATQKKVSFLKQAADVAGVALVKAFDMLLGAASKAVDVLADLDGLAEKTGASVESLSRLQKVAQMTGQDFGQVGDALTQLQKGMGGLDTDSKKVNGALERLGVSSKDAAGKLRDPSEVMIEAARSLQNYRNDAGKTALVNDLLGKSNAKLLPYLNDVAEHVDKFSGASRSSAANAAAFKDNIGEIGVRFSELGGALAEAALPALISLTGQFKEFVASGKFKEFVDGAATAVGKFASFVDSSLPALITATKVAAAFFAVFIAAPAAMMAVGPMLASVGNAVNVIAQGAAVFHAVGTTAVGSLSRVMLAGSAMFALFAGWEIGTYLREQFVEVRVAALTFVGLLLQGWENVKYYGTMAWNAISVGLNMSLGQMQGSFAGFLGTVASGFAAMGAGDTASEIGKYADALRTAGAARQEQARTTVISSDAMRAAHEGELASIGESMSGLIDAEMVADKVSESKKNAAVATRSLAVAAGGNAAAVSKETQAFNNLIDSIKAKTAASKIEFAIGADASESQKINAQVSADLADKKLKLTSAQKASVDAAIKDLAVSEQKIKQQAGEKDVAAWIEQSTQARAASTAALAAEADMYGKSADAREMAKIGLAAEAELEKFKAEQIKAGKPLSDEQIKRLEAERDERVEVEKATLAQTKAYGYAAQLAAENTRAGAQAISDPAERGMALLDIDAKVWSESLRLAKDGTDAKMKLQDEYNTWYARKSKEVVAEADVARTKDVLDNMSAIDDATRAAAEGMAASFGRVGSAIGGLTTALSGYGKGQAAIAAQLATSVKDAGGDPVKIEKAKTAAAEQSARAQVRSYGDMAGAAKGFFSENSKGYKLMAGAEKAFRAYEMAMAIESMVTKGGLLTAFTGLFVTSKATEAAAEATATGTSLAFAATQASAWGITAVVKAIASLPFPLNLVAGAATLAAVVAIGAKMTGSVGSGGKSAADMQKEQGTGGVFGDSSAKSDSIGRSLEKLEEHSDRLLPINRGMLQALRTIEASMKGLTNLLVRAPGITDGTNMNIATGREASGNFVSSFVKAIFGKTTTNIVDSGIQFGGSVSELQEGKGYAQYASVDTVKKRLFGLSKKTTNTVQTAALDDEFTQQFGKIFTGIEAALTSAAVALGVGAGHVTSTLDAMTIATTKISLKGLTGEALTEALNAVLSKAMDDISQKVFPEMEGFRQVGEGYAETVVRLAANYGELDSILQSIGTTFGATGIGSLAAREHLIALSGGLEKLSEQAGGFADNFLTEAERLAPVQKYVTEELGRLGLSGIKTRDDFKQAVLGLANSGALATAAGAELYTGLMSLQEAFAMVTPAIEAAGAAVKSDEQIREDAAETANRNRALEIEIMELTGDKAGALAAARADELIGLDASTVALIKNRNALQDQAAAAAAAITGANTAFGDLKTAVSKEKEKLTIDYQRSVTDINTKATGDANAIRSQVDGFKQQASAIESVFDKLSSALAATVVQSDAFDRVQRRAAQELLARAAIITRAGGTASIAGLEEALAVVAKPADMLFSSFEDYARDQARTGNTIAALQSNAKQELDFGAMTVAGLEGTIRAIESTAATALEVLKEEHLAEMARLDDVVNHAQLELNAVLGVSVAVLSLADAVRAFGVSLNLVQQMPAPLSVAGAYQLVLGRTPEKAGLDFWTTAFGDTVDAAELAEFKRAAQPELDGRVNGSLQELGVNGGVRLATGSDGRVSASVGDGGLAQAINRLGTLVDNQGAAIVQLAQSQDRLASDFSSVSEGGNGLRVIVMNEVTTV